MKPGPACGMNERSLFKNVVGLLVATPELGCGVYSVAALFLLRGPLLGSVARLQPVDVKLGYRLLKLFVVFGLPCENVVLNVPAGGVQPIKRLDTEAKVIFAISALHCLSVVSQEPVPSLIRWGQLTRREQIAKAEDFAPGGVKRYCSHGSTYDTAASGKWQNNPRILMVIGKPTRYKAEPFAIPDRYCTCGGVGSQSVARGIVAAVTEGYNPAFPMRCPVWKSRKRAP